MKRLQTAGAVLSIALFTLGALPAAHAHVSVVKTVPQYQSTVNDLPSQVSITFSAPLVVVGSKNPNTITVLDPNKNSVTLQDAKVDGADISVAIDTSNPVAGAYTVRYRVVSTDGHGVSGSYSFALSKGAQAQPLPKPTIEPEHGFWHLHLAHVLEGAAALLLIGGWALYRLRFAPRK